MASYFASVFILIAICTCGLVDVTLTQSMAKLSAARDVERLEKKADLGLEIDQLTDVLTRNQRSPYDDDDDDYYDDYNSYDDYSDDLDSRNSRHGHKRKRHRRPLLSSILGGQGGCRGHGCDGGHGWRPQSGGYYNQGLQGGSSASASAGSAGGSPYYGGGHSQANSQSASFSLGPYSATFSSAQASAGNRNEGFRDYYDY